MTTNATIVEKNLFGETIKVPVRGKHYIHPHGYAGRPGTGPDGNTCGDCQHIRRAQRWAKCSLFAHPSGCRATDILVRSPACWLFVEAQA